MDALYELRAYLKHLWQSGGKHSVHSPIVYELLTQVLGSKKHFYCFDAIEQRRKELLNSNQTISVRDFGAGSRKDDSEVRRISSIARNALQSPRCAQALFKLINRFCPMNMLELGTSLGITTSYMAMAHDKAKVYSIEGAAEIAAIAKHHFNQMNIQNIEQRIGQFDLILERVLDEMKVVDFSLIDGNHRKAPTLKYFEAIIKRCNEQSIIVLDDIHWSSEMAEAWERIAQDERISISIDFFHFGVLLLRSGVEKQHFQLRLPS